MDRGAWWATVLGFAQSDMTEQLSTAHNSQKSIHKLILQPYTYQTHT